MVRSLGRTWFIHCIEVVYMYLEGSFMRVFTVLYVANENIQHKT